MNAMFQKAVIVNGLFALAGFAPCANATLLFAATVNGENACAADENAVCSFGTQLPDAFIGINGILRVGSSSGSFVIGGLEFLGFGAQSGQGPPLNVLGSDAFRIENPTAVPISAQITISATGFTPSVSSESTRGVGTWGIGDKSSVTWTWLIDPGNEQGAETSTDRPGIGIDAFTHIASVAFEGFSHFGSANVAAPNSYSMTLGLDLTLAPGDSLASSQSISALVDASVPEPGSLALLGLGLAGLVFRSKHAR